MDEKSIIEGLKPICLCCGIQQKVVARHISAGVRTVAALQQKTGAGSGSCLGKQCTPKIEALIRSAERK